MGLMAHFQRKSMEAAQQILGDQATVVDHANGTYATSDLTTGAGAEQFGYLPVQLYPARVWIRVKDRDRFLAAGSR
jgi:hypothetical protein